MRHERPKGEPFGRKRCARNTQSVGIRVVGFDLTSMEKKRGSVTRASTTQRRNSNLAPSRMASIRLPPVKLELAQQLAKSLEGLATRRRIGGALV